VIGGKPNWKQAGATGWDIRRKQLGDLGGNLDGLDAHVFEGLIGGRIPELAERLRWHVLAAPPGQKALGTAGNQLLQYLCAQALGQKGFLTPLPVP